MGVQTPFKEFKNFDPLSRYRVKKFAWLSFLGSSWTQITYKLLIFKHTSRNNKIQQIQQCSIEKKIKNPKTCVFSEFSAEYLVTFLGHLH